MESDYLWGALGGGMIGLAGAILLLGNGRIMGASGILGGLLTPASNPKLLLERAVFVLAVIAVPALLHFGANIDQAAHVTNNIPMLIAAGLLVGAGTRLANGCTSGHGVCGMSRLSIRGIVATLIYIGAGVLTVAALRHIFGALS
ncbi:YeeE/YedE family protein [Epibacterium sp. SM1969]|uniref:YeeE/YedE family protein n=1 Tax=Tritonibacter aquimaris TaxID=2663379 RepID=A0A844AM90_9RHOB|nr:YeeE/YedE thiosulfate transporter family protein [Tritonibacter aquimaris]MQY43029.1 YeeE/YedE family protein [Tritonibacter aquimaris]